MWDPRSWFRTSTATLVFCLCRLSFEYHNYVSNSVSQAQKKDGQSEWSRGISRKVAYIPSRKAVSWKCFLSAKRMFDSPQYTVLHVFFGSNAKARNCLQDSTHRNFFECGTDIKSVRRMSSLPSELTATEDRDTESDVIEHMRVN